MQLFSLMCSAPKSAKRLDNDISLNSKMKMKGNELSCRNMQKKKLCKIEIKTKHLIACLIPI